MIKDKLQDERSLIIISLIRNLFDNLISLNYIESNEKEKYKLVIICDYNVFNETYSYNFYIVRGILDEEAIIKTSFSIKDNNNIYNELENIIINYTNSELYLYTSRISNIFGNIYKIVLNNLVEIEFQYKTDKDRLFFEQMRPSKIRNIKDNKRLILTQSNNK